MANFRTHFFVAAGASGVLALTCLTAGVAQKSDTPVLFALGTLGGLLPDIDSDHSVPIKIAFTLLAFWLAFLAVFRFIGHYTVLELALLWLATFLLVRYGVLETFNRFTVHRGAFHSLLAAVFFGLGTASLAYRLLEQAAASAWLYGSFITLGYVVHLLLDECFSVDLFNRRIKRSFGTALKPLSLEQWGATLLLLAACVAAYASLPPPGAIARQAWRHLAGHYQRSADWFMPSNGRWFEQR